MEKNKCGKKILYLHGGAYINQPIELHWKFLYKLINKINVSVTIPIYPKAPFYNYKDSFNMVISLYKELLINTNPNDIIFMGDSSGGGFALALAEKLKDFNLPQPKDIILISPWLDVTMTNSNIKGIYDPLTNLEFLSKSIKLYSDITELTNYMLSPIYGDITNLGKISIFIGTYEVFLPDVRKLKKMLENKNIEFNYFEYQKMFHCFPLTSIPEATQCLNQIIDIINSK
jgi:acetyl esterase/lipase